MKYRPQDCSIGRCCGYGSTASTPTERHSSAFMIHKFFTNLERRGNAHAYSGERRRCIINHSKRQILLEKIMMEALYYVL